MGWVDANDELANVKGHARRSIMAVSYRRLPRFQYMLPKTLDETIKALGERKGAARLLAGGTDLVPQLKRRETDIPEYVIDLKGIAGLDEIAYDEQSGLKIGPLATINSIAQSPIVRDLYPSLLQAALSMASPQVRNRGTFAGNICSAVPSADSAPALLTLDAMLRVIRSGGERVIPIDRFFTGPRKTVMEADEMLVEIMVPKATPDARGAYIKLSPRHAMDLAIVGVAAYGVCNNGHCKDISIGLGAVAPTPFRAGKAEAVLRGQHLTPATVEEAARVASTECHPIDDHRASAEYRCDMVYVLTKRVLNKVLFG